MNAGDIITEEISHRGGNSKNVMEHSHLCIKYWLGKNIIYKFWYFEVFEEILS